MTGVAPLDVNGNVEHSAGRVLRWQLAVEMMVQRFVSIGRDPQRRVAGDRERDL